MRNSLCHGMKIMVVVWGFGACFGPAAPSYALHKCLTKPASEPEAQRWVFRSQKPLSAAEVVQTKQHLQQRFQWLTGRCSSLTILPTRQGHFLFVFTEASNAFSGSQQVALIRPAVLQWKVKTETGLWIESKLESEYLEKVATQYERGQWQVRFQYRDQGIEQLAQLTRQPRGQTLGLFLNKRLISAPRIQEPILGGEALITGLFSATEAAQILQDIRWAMAPVALDFVGVAAVSR